LMVFLRGQSKEFWLIILRSALPDRFYEIKKSGTNTHTAFSVNKSTNDFNQ